MNTTLTDMPTNGLSGPVQYTPNGGLPFQFTEISSCAVGSCTDSRADVRTTKVFLEKNSQVRGVGLVRTRLNTAQGQVGEQDKQWSIVWNRRYTTGT
jgi:hypothetical protein